MNTTRTLIADDQPDVLEALRLLLKNEGFQTEAAQSPAAVLDKLRSNSFDLVLMDLNYTRDATSGNEGLDLLARIQAIDHTLPVVAMTAWASVDLAVEAMRRGVCDFVLKPLGELPIGADAEEPDGEGAQQAHSTSPGTRGVRGRPRRRPRLAAPEHSGDSGLSNRGRIASGAVAERRFFDVLDLGGGKVALAIADVIGKGVPAALLMSNLQATVRALAAPSAQPSELAARLNHSILRNTTRGKFVTFFYGVLDSRTATFTYINAGHCTPIVVQSSGEVARLEPGGAVLGVFSDWSYEQAEVTLASGDRLLLFTDGVTEAANSIHEEFGEERLVQLAVALRERDAAEIKDRILQNVAAFTAGSNQDDATLVALARSGAGC